MARPRTLRMWGLAASVLCLLALAGGVGDAAPAAEARATPVSAAAVANVSVASDAAVLPVRVDDSVRAARSAAGSRLLVLLAVLAALLALPSLLRRGSAAVAGGTAPARVRRYAIALRAPPLRFA